MVYDIKNYLNQEITIEIITENNNFSIIGSCDLKNDLKLILKVKKENVHPKSFDEVICDVLSEIQSKIKMELMSDVQHDIWAHWMKYQFSQCIENEDGSLTIPSEKVERWRGQLDTSYFDLPESSKESDRNQVRKFSHLI